MPLTTAFIDANIFLYAVGREHPFRDHCRRVLDGISSGTLVATTSVEVMQEILHILHRRGRTAEGAELCRKLLSLFPNMLAVTPAEMATACELLEHNPGITSRDAVHAANMRHNGLTTIITLDSHFDRVEGIHRVDPGEEMPDVG